jgi:hypothetical protein
MNELERLRYLVSTGTATPQEAERLKTLLGQRNLEGEVSFTPESYLTPTTAGIRMPWDQPQGIPTTSQAGSPLITPTMNNPVGVDGLLRDRTTGLAGTKNLSPANFETEAEYIQYINETTGGDSVTAGEVWREANKNKTAGEGQPGEFMLPLLTPAGSNLQTELYSFGRALGAGEGAKGRTLAGVAAGGAAALDIARNIASGIGFEKRNRYVQDFYRDQQQEQNFTPNTQSQGFNTVGGFEDGGEVGDDRPRRERPALTLFPKKYGETNWFDQESDATGRPLDGRTFFESVQKTAEVNKRIREAVENVKAGSTDERDLYYNQFSKLRPGALTIVPASTHFKFEEGGEATGQQQMIQQVAGMLQQGMSPDGVVDVLIQRGMPEDQAVEIVQGIMQQMQGEPQETQQPEFKMKNGGVFNKKPGDTVTILHKGQKKTVTIKEITPDGKIIT